MALPDTERRVRYAALTGLAPAAARPAPARRPARPRARRARRAHVLQFGGSRGNPGPAGAGARCSRARRRGGVVDVQWLGASRTNNEAEYAALNAGLRAACALRHAGVLGALTVQGDSKLVISQVSGVWKVNAANLRPLHAEAARLLEQLAALGPGGCELEHIPRAQNRRADELANQAMDNEATSSGGSGNYRFGGY